MSHEIRTPLNAIVGFSNILPSVDDKEVQQQYVGIINENNDILLRLIDDILDLSKIESGVIEIQKKTFDFSLYFDVLSSSFSKRCTNANVKLIANNPYKKCIIKSDSDRIGQLITNFVSNSIKYTKAGHINVSYICEDNNIKITVEDTGIGISEDNKVRIFKRFEKLNNFAQGTGLGLAICKAITDAFNGKIGFDSKENIGSTFWAIIPCEIVEIT